MKIVFPEYHHPNIQAAMAQCPDVQALPAADLKSACQLVVAGQADALIAGIDYASRDVILACREFFPMGTYTSLQSSTPVAYSTFSGLAVMQRDSETYLLADMAACKHPTKTQLTEIIHQTSASAHKILSTPPKLALLSFSTLGSGGKDDFISLAKELVTDFSSSDIIIDGEMQLDAALNPRIAAKKAPDSPVVGQANVLIAPDLNSGNLLYKALEQLGGFTVAGPILQGFKYPVSDLSRGSTTADIVLTIQSLARLAS